VKKAIMSLIILAVSLLLLNNVQTVSAGVEPSPFNSEINKLHSIELNVAAIDKQIGKLPESNASPEGITKQLEEIAKKLGDLDTRLADVLNVLPMPMYDDPYDGQEEVLSSLENIKSDASRIYDVAEPMGVEPTPFKEAALSVQNNAHAIMNRADGILILYQPLWVTNACQQQRFIGFNFFGAEMERICREFHRRPFDTNIEDVLHVISDPVNGIVDTALDRERMKYIILCGLPPFPSRSTIDCNAKFALYGRADELPEWSVYTAVIRPYVLEQTESIQNAVNEAYIHMLPATKIMQFKLAGGLVGCTGFAKVFNYLVRSLPIETRYVATVSVADYRDKCGCTAVLGASCEGNVPRDIFRSGHQVAALHLPNGKWRMLNTAASELEWTRDYNTGQVIEVSSPSEFVERYVAFGSAGPNFVVAVEEPFFLDDLGLEAPFVLEHLYASGKRTDPLCRFDP